MFHIALFVRPTLIDLPTSWRHAASSPALAQMAGAPASRGALGPARDADRIDGAALEMLYWAAVAFVIAITAGVLSYAAGTPALVAVTTLTGYLFAALACLLATGALLRARISATRRRQAEQHMPRSPALRARMNGVRR
jgi:uncharacterized membrane protein YtjA (UPF0391 family)